MRGITGGCFMTQANTQNQSKEESPLPLNLHETLNRIFKKGENAYQLIHSLQDTVMCSARCYYEKKGLKAQHLKIKRKDLIL